MSEPSNPGQVDRREADTTPTPAAQRPGSAAQPAVRRSFVGSVALGLLGRWGARLGLAWIGLLALLAVFAPLLASSHPLLWKVDGRVSSPWLEHLSRIDVVLLTSFFVAVGLLAFWRMAVATRIHAWLWISFAMGLAATLAEIVVGWPRSTVLIRVLTIGLALGFVLGLAWIALGSSASGRVKGSIAAIGVALGAALFILPIQPPANVVYSQYREATAQGRVQWQWLTPLPYSPGDYQRDRLSLEGVDPRLLAPSIEHPLGTEEGGADVLSRMIHASRIALAIGLIATSIALLIGVVIGGLMGYFAGWIDLLGMRLVEIFSAIPVIFLLIMIVAFYGRNLYLMMVIIGLTGWVGYAVFVRAEFLKLRKMDYVQAAHACGTPLWSVLFRHMLPNGITPVLVLASFGIASAILTESTLSFIGLGLVEEPSWGEMLNQGRRAGSQWGLVVFPGLAIFLTVFAYNLVGEALRDALDPKVVE